VHKECLHLLISGRHPTAPLVSGAASPPSPPAAAAVTTPAADHDAAVDYYVRAHLPAQKSHLVRDAAVGAGVGLVSGLMTFVPLGFIAGGFVVAELMKATSNGDRSAKTLGGVIGVMVPVSLYVVFNLVPVETAWSYCAGALAAAGAAVGPLVFSASRRRQRQAMEQQLRAQAEQVCRMARAPLGNDQVRIEEERVMVGKIPIPRRPQEGT